VSCVTLKKIQGAPWVQKKEKLPKTPDSLTTRKSF
jgi:hypothetical protein